MGVDDDSEGNAKTALRRSVFDPDDLALLGKRLGEYRVDDIIGVGGMGIVFKGEQPLIKKKVAIKVLKGSLGSEAKDGGSRLLEEARVANAVHHPGIVDVIGFGQAPDGRSYLVMEFLDGEPLDARLASKGRLDVLETLRLLNELLAPLEAAHAAGVIHRDLKPGNVFLQRLAENRVFPKLLDFGLARFADATGRGSGIVGTPSYMAPEQAKEGEVTPAVDLYALGCMTYELLSGRPPFEGSSAWGVIEQQLNGTPRPIAEVVLDLDDEVAALVHELLEKDPAKRPTAKQARREVARLLRAREEAATVGDPKARPSTRETLKVEPPSDSREAKTVLGLEGVDVPIPVKGPRPRVRSGVVAKTQLEAAPVTVDEKVPMEVKPFEETQAEPRLQTGPGPAVWIGVLLAIILVGVVLLFLFKP